MVVCEEIFAGQSPKCHLVVMQGFREDNQIFNISVNRFVRLFDFQSLFFQKRVKHVLKLPVEVVQNRFDENFHV